MLADDFPRERRTNSSEQFHRYSPESTLRPLNDTPTVRTSRPSTHALNSTVTAECCDADHISEASLPKGQDAASRGQVRAWVSSIGAACGVCPPRIILANRSRPRGVRGASLSMSIRLSQGTLTSRQHQLPRPEPEGQPIESSHLDGQRPRDLHRRSCRLAGWRPTATTAAPTRS